MCVFNCALNKQDSEFKDVALAETKRPRAELSIVNVSNPERSNTELSTTELPKIESGDSPGQAERPVDHRLFNWITILLLTGWILVVGVVANFAEVKKSTEAPTVQTFIKGLF
jgi:hypothetical protein